MQGEKFGKEMKKKTFKTFQWNEEWNQSTTSTLFITLSNLYAVEMLFWMHIIWVSNNCIPTIHILWVIVCPSTLAISLQMCSSHSKKMFVKKTATKVKKI